MEMNRTSHIQVLSEDTERTLLVDQTEFWKVIEKNPIGNLLAGARLKACSYIALLFLSSISAFGESDKEVVSELGKSVSAGIGKAVCAFPFWVISQDSVDRAKVPGKDSKGFPLSHKMGDPFMPVVRVDASYQDVDQGWAASAFDVEIGPLESVAGEWRHAHIWKDESEDTFDFDQIHFLYRTRPALWLEVDAALGLATFEGADTTTGPSAGLPIRFWPTRWVGAEFRPEWTAFGGGEFVGDYDASVLLRYKCISLRGGYRWLHGLTEASFSGPYVGISVRF